MMKKIIIGILLIVSFISCEKQNESIDIKGFLFRDEIGNTIAQRGDITDDWGYFDVWNKHEKNLFNTKINTICDPVEETKDIIGIYPNPCYQVININNSMQQNSLINIRIVDKNLNIILSKDSLARERNTLLLEKNWMQSKDSSSNITEYLEDGRYRIYYQIITKECGYQGHGDIIVGKVDYSDSTLD